MFVKSTNRVVIAPAATPTMSAPSKALSKGRAPQFRIRSRAYSIHAEGFDAYEARSLLDLRGGSFSDLTDAAVLSNGSHPLALAREGKWDDRRRRPREIHHALRPYGVSRVRDDFYRGAPLGGGAPRDFGWSDLRVRPARNTGNNLLRRPGRTVEV
jgi:hypothetical protein